MLQEAANAIRTIGADAGGAVVGIGRRGPRGSGLVIASGRVVTNAHNLGDHQVRVAIGLSHRLAKKLHVGHGQV